jgi:EAL domain-containing protein (putative c-di-GMP-specific phosphodiesterase class I)
LKQLAFLQQQKCDVVQGFLVARAMPAETLVQWLESRKGSVVAAQQQFIGARLVSG